MAILDLANSTSPIVLASAATVLVLYLIASSIINYGKLKQFDGPFFAKFSGSWLLWHSLKGTVYQAEQDALKKYGCPVRIAPDLLLTDDPDVVRHISAPNSKWSRSHWYAAMKLDPRMDTVFSTQNEKLHAELRSKEVGGYNGRNVPALESNIDDGISDLLKLIDSYEGKSMDFASIARYFTLDTLGTIAFGKQFGFMQKNEDLWNYSKANTAFMSVLELCVNHAWIYSIIASPIVQFFAAPRITDKTGVGPALKFARDAVAERFAGKHADRQDMLNHFKSKGLNQQQMEAEAFLQIIAGSDSTTTILRSLLYSLVGTPSAYIRLRKEVDDAVAAGKASLPVTYTEAQKLPFLAACVWEGVRVFPPLFGMKIKTAPPDGDTIKGIYYPPGTELGMCDVSIQRRKDIFGDDAHLFKPQRWLDVDRDTFVKYSRTADIVFGAGKYTCLGKHIAMVELYKTIFELFRRYDWAMTDPLAGIKFTSQMTYDQWNMHLIATPRQ